MTLKQKEDKGMSNAVNLPHYGFGIKETLMGKKKHYPNTENDRRINKKKMERVRERTD